VRKTKHSSWLLVENRSPCENTREECLFVNVFFGPKVMLFVALQISWHKKELC
jgi:hypothetical protein